jgi:hypothetical protein
VCVGGLAEARDDTSVQSCVVRARAVRMVSDTMVRVCVGVWVWQRHDAADSELCELERHACG